MSQNGLAATCVKVAEQPIHLSRKAELSEKEGREK